MVGNGNGADFIVTFFQAKGFTGEFFDEQINLVDIEVMKLKELLETAS